MNPYSAKLDAWLPGPWSVDRWGETWARTILRLACGRQLTSRILATADWLYPLAGTEHPAYKRTRYLLRCLAFKGATRNWLEFLFSDPALLDLLQRRPSLAEKPHRPYLRKDLSAGLRLAALQAHYTIGREHAARGLLLGAAREETELAWVEGRNGEPFRLVLCPPGSLQKEGELVLRLEMGDRALYRLAFSLIGDPAGPTLFIGCVQGASKGNDGAALIRAATKSLHNLRPRDLLIDAIQVLADALGVKYLLGVGQEQHIYRHMRKQRDFMQDYDALWAEVGGSRGAEGSFELPGLPVQRPLSEYPSKKRAEAARRQALENQVLAAIRDKVTHYAALPDQEMVA